MNSNKFLFAWIAGTVVLFVFGYLIYGMLLADFMKNHSGPATGVAKSSQEYILWLIGVANLVYAFLLTYVFSRAGVATPAKGFALGATIGLLTSLSTDLITYATTNLATCTGILGDVVAFTVLAGVAGAVIGWVKGMGTKAA
jgi:hypothetical protein